MTNTPTIEDALAELSLFAGFTRADLRRVSRHMTPICVKAGRVLIREGEPGSECMIVVEGRAEVSRQGTVVATLAEGEVMGEIALLDGGSRTATVVAVTDMVLEVLTGNEFRSVLAERPDLARKVMAGLAGRVRELDVRAFT
jgi:CRP/FNR family transcriptional regulator, cyclic AMP receptor protein